ncbi:hypothetical protein Hanom_Chr11g01002941 [Helianthus anomalus]
MIAIAKLHYCNIKCFMVSQQQALFRIGRGEPPPILDTSSTETRDFILTYFNLPRLTH